MRWTFTKDNALQAAAGIRRQQRQGWTANGDRPLLGTGTKRNPSRGDGVARLWGGMVATTTNSERVCLPCPVTGGVSTRMTQQSFVAACGAKRSRRTTNCWGHDIAKEVFPRRCDWCKGKVECWPGELVLADVVKTKVEDKNNMTTVAGFVCDVCGKPANNKKNKSRGMTLCSSCKGIVPCVDRLDVVVAMMQRTGKAEELLNKLRPHDDDNSDLEAVVRDARETLVKTLPSGEVLEDAQSLYDIATIAEEVAWYIQEQQEKITRLNDDADVMMSITGIMGCPTYEVVPVLRELAARMGCAPGKVSEAIYALDHNDDNKSYRLEQEVYRLKRENEYLAQQIKCQSPLDEALLEWARRQYEANKLRIVIGDGDENN